MKQLEQLRPSPAVLSNGCWSWHTSPKQKTAENRHQLFSQWLHNAIENLAKVKKSYSRQTASHLSNPPWRQQPENSLHKNQVQQVKNHPVGSR
jgi:hypothetical protein